MDRALRGRLQGRGPRPLRHERGRPARLHGRGAQPHPAARRRLRERREGDPRGLGLALHAPGVCLAPGPYARPRERVPGRAPASRRSLPTSRGSWSRGTSRPGTAPSSPSPSTRAWEARWRDRPRNRCASTLGTAACACWPRPPHPGATCPGPRAAWRGSARAGSETLLQPDEIRQLIQFAKDLPAAFPADRRRRGQAGGRRRRVRVRGGPAPAPADPSVPREPPGPRQRLPEPDGRRASEPFRGEAGPSRRGAGAVKRRAAALRLCAAGLLVPAPRRRYPLDGYESTGIRRLLGPRLGPAGSRARLAQPARGRAPRPRGGGPAPSRPARARACPRPIPR